MTFRQIRNATQGIELDRTTWAQDTQTVFRVNVSGRGSRELDEIEFGLPYQGVPFFSYGVELAPDETLTTGDFPFVSAGVARWKTSVEPNQVVEPRYLGATIFVNVATKRSYDLVFSFIFEGTAYQNPNFTTSA